MQSGAAWLFVFFIFARYLLRSLLKSLLCPWPPVSSAFLFPPTKAMAIDGFTVQSFSNSFRVLLQFTCYDFYIHFDTDFEFMWLFEEFERKRRWNATWRRRRKVWGELGGQGEGKEGTACLEILVCVSYFFDLWLMMTLTIVTFSSSPVTLPRFAYTRFFSFFFCCLDACLCCLVCSVASDMYASDMLLLKCFRYD